MFHCIMLNYFFLQPIIEVYHLPVVFVTILYINSVDLTILASCFETKDFENINIKVEQLIYFMKKIKQISVA